MTPTPDVFDTRQRLRQSPICSAREDGRYCRRIATSVVGVGGQSFESRCRRHADPTALRVCLDCRGENRTDDEWHCDRCATGAERGSAEYAR